MIWVENRGEQVTVKDSGTPRVVDRHEARSSFRFERTSYVVLAQEHSLLAHRICLFFIISYFEILEAHRDNEQPPMSTNELLF